MQLLKHRNFALLWVGHVISLLGDWVLDIALPVLVYQLTGSATALGVMVAIEAIPGIVLAPISGIFVDRWNKRRILITTNVLLGLSVLLLFLVATPRDLWLIFLVGFLNACLGTFLFPARSALLPVLVSEEELVGANSLMTLTTQGSRLVGPALGSIVIGLAGSRLAFALDAGSFFLAALCVAAIGVAPQREAPVQETQPGAGGLFRDLLDGLRVIGSTPLLWATLMVWSVLLLAVGVVSAIVVVFVREALGAAETSFGYLLSAQGLGMLVGGATMMVFGARVKPLSAIVGGVFLAGIMFLLGANAPSLPLASIAVCGMGAMMAVSGITIQTVFQTAPPATFRGRVLATNDAVASLMVLIGAAGAGLLTDLIGVRSVMNVAGVLVIIAALLGLVLLRPDQEVRQAVGRTAQPAEH